MISVIFPPVIHTLLQWLHLPHRVLCPPLGGFLSWARGTDLSPRHLPQMKMDQAVGNDNRFYRRLVSIGQQILALAEKCKTLIIIRNLDWLKLQKVYCDKVYLFSLMWCTAYICTTLTKTEFARPGAFKCNISEKERLKLLLTQLQLFATKGPWKTSVKLELICVSLCGFVKVKSAIETNCSLKPSPTSNCVNLARLLCCWNFISESLQICFVNLQSESYSAAQTVSWLSF